MLIQVESVVDEKNVKGVRHLLIRWKGYGEESDTWEPESTLNCPQLLKAFEEKRKSRPQKDKKSKKKRKSNQNSDEADDWDENEQFEVTFNSTVLKSFEALKSLRS